MIFIDSELFNPFIWAITGALAYGFSVARFQGRWPHLAYGDRYFDRIVALVMSVMFGPIYLFALMVLIFLDWKWYGWKL